MPPALEGEVLTTGLPGSECEVAQSCPTLCDPLDCSLSGSSVHGIFQARVLEWIAIAFSRGSSQPGNRTPVSRIAGRRFTVCEGCCESVKDILASLQRAVGRLGREVTISPGLGPPPFPSPPVLPLSGGASGGPRSSRKGAARGTGGVTCRLAGSGWCCPQPAATLWGIPTLQGNAFLRRLRSAWRS